MAHVVDAHVVMRAPEKRHIVEYFVGAQDVPGGRLSLALRDHPVLDANALAGVRAGPARDVAGRKDTRHTRLQVRIHRHAKIDHEAGLLSKLYAWPQADADHHHIRGDGRSVVEDDRIGIDALRRALEMEFNPLLLVQRLNELAKLRSEHTLQWEFLRSNDMHVDIARPQRRGDLESDEAGADHDGAFRELRGGDDGPTVGQGSQVID